MSWKTHRRKSQCKEYQIICGTNFVILKSWDKAQDSSHGGRLHELTYGKKKSRSNAISDFGFFTYLKVTFCNNSFRTLCLQYPNYCCLPAHQDPPFYARHHGRALLSQSELTEPYDQSYSAGCAPTQLEHKYKDINTSSMYYQWLFLCRKKARLHWCVMRLWDFPTVYKCYFV